jgi:hypothetical protein
VHVPWWYVGVLLSFPLHLPSLLLFFGRHQRHLYQRSYNEVVRQLTTQRTQHRQNANEHSNLATLLAASSTPAICCVPLTKEAICFVPLTKEAISCAPLTKEAISCVPLTKEALWGNGRLAPHSSALPAAAARSLGAAPR